MCHQFVNPMNDDSKWLNALDASQWLSHISLISSSSADVAKFVHLHGTDHACIPAYLLPPN
jgi:site-specific recombinase